MKKKRVWSLFTILKNIYYKIYLFINRGPDKKPKTVKTKSKEK